MNFIKISMTVINFFLKKSIKAKNNTKKLDF